MSDADQERRDDNQPEEKPIVYLPVPTPKEPKPISPVFPPPPDDDEDTWRDQSSVFPPPPDED